MLEEHEFVRITELHDACERELQTMELQAIPDSERRRRRDSVIAQRNERAMCVFREITGVSPREPFEVMHHRVSLFGPPCPECGKALRSSRTSKCYECGWAGTQA
jgi:hypothetical protein